MPDSLSAIRNYYRINENLATAGQPTADQFNTIRDAGFDAVINLATPDSPYALRDEAILLESLGLEYCQIPVNFKAPHLDDFQRFDKTMQCHRDKKLFVHCALNWRVSAFIYLYRMTRDHQSSRRALHDLHAVWLPDETWKQFINSVLAQKKLET